MLRVEDTIGRCPRCRARMRVARVFDRRNNIVPYISRCEGCSYEHRGELDYGLLAATFSLPAGGTNNVQSDDACPECAEDNADKPGGGDDDEN